MTKGEALKKMQAVKAYMTSGNPIWDVTEIGEAFGMAIEALERPEPQWIPCKEQMPKESSEVLVTVRNVEKPQTAYTMVAKWNTVVAEWVSETGWFDPYYDEVEDDCSKVVAWMPLPEPYEEGER